MPIVPAKVTHAFLGTNCISVQCGKFFRASFYFGVCCVEVAVRFALGWQASLWNSGGTIVCQLCTKTVLEPVTMMGVFCRWCQNAVWHPSDLVSDLQVWSLSQLLLQRTSMFSFVYAIVVNKAGFASCWTPQHPRLFEKDYMLQTEEGLFIRPFGV